jgi:hypothetical protein
MLKENIIPPARIEEQEKILQDLMKASKLEAQTTKTLEFNKYARTTNERQVNYRIK